MEQSEACGASGSMERDQQHPHHTGSPSFVATQGQQPLRSISTKTAGIWKQGRGVMELTYLHSPRARPFSISSLTRLSVGSGQLDNLPWLSQATKSRSYLLIPPAPQPFHVFPCYPANPPLPSIHPLTVSWIPASFTSMSIPAFPHKHL